MLFSLESLAQNDINHFSDSILYKTVNQTNLYLHKYVPPNFDSKKQYSCIIFYHGGGWSSGSYIAFHKQANYFAARGLIVFSVEYRVRSRNNTTPFDATEDAHDAFAFVVTNSKKMNIDVKKIIVGGGSSGGHLATTNCFWQANNVKPFALILFNPVLDTGPNGYGYKSMNGRYMEISPIENIALSHPPCIIMVGTKDKVLPVVTAEKYKQLVEQNKGRCDLVLYQDQEHGFFNNQPYLDITLIEADIFLQSLGILKAKN